MDLDVVLSARGLDADTLKGRAVVVIDVLRASSTVVTALSNGARAVIPAADLGEAGRLAAMLDPDVSVVGGERGGEKLAGYAAGNSPLEYGPEVVDRKTVVLTTSNGTAAMAMARAAASAAIGAFLNADAVSGLVSQAAAHGPGVTLICAGSGGRVSLEDTLCAGLLVSRVAPPEEVARLGDSAQIAHALYRGTESQLARALFGAEHTQRLIDLGFADDVTYCARIDAVPVLPVLDDNRIVLAR
ncbi:MAG: 2-phosphosulfolactate phosphatase [Bacteroidota bacterium]